MMRAMLLRYTHALLLRYHYVADDARCVVARVRARGSLMLLMRR